MEREINVPEASVAPGLCRKCKKPYKPLRDGMCQPCYRRAKKYGSAIYIREEVEDVTVEWVRGKCTQKGDCLVWEGTTGKEGRPQTSDRRSYREEGKTLQIALHRWMYEKATGETLRKGQHVRQTCGNKLCLAAGHLKASVPRQGRTPLGDAGQYKGKREDHLERCANGHERTEENTYRDAHGRLACRECVSHAQAARQGKGPDEHQWKPRKSWENTPECPNGHTFAEVGWYDNGETRICKRCFAEKERKRWLRVNYNMTPEDFEALLVAQDLACAICSRSFDPETLPPCVDHSHVTGLVRGLLCQRCNLGLGHFGDATDRLRSAVRYLEIAEQREPQDSSGVTSPS
ncbi:endonuclease VII domain-containing protein [Streptomyces sp. NPDC089799]|uniref:endonuclease VII domain-containing protein n=1 Tax=Streptomyces sp. NPDC089799 TaxID=3155066 RepID=UPI0034264828